jgi:uncharacterized small protein (DUF1192 family)
MKRKRPARSQQTKRSYLTVREIEQRVSLLLLLLHHNFETLVQRAQARRK